MPKDKTVKEKSKKQPSPQDAEDQILAYLVQQNRPYSATDVFNNLQQAISKPNCVKALATLAESNAIQAKTFGKQVIYCALQVAGARESSDVELDCAEGKQYAIDELNQLQTELATLVEDNKRAAREVAEIESVLSVAQLQEQQDLLLQEESSFNTSIAAFESAKPKQETAITRNYSAEEEQQIDRLLHQLLVRWKQTRKQVENMVQEIAGTLNKKRSEVPEFREEIGLDEVDGDMPLPSYV